MYLVRLQIRGFRLFPHPVTIDFPPRGVIGIRGFNLKSGSGSDSGKSSILQALAVCFGYSSFPMTEQKTWLADVKPQIDVTCVHDGHRYDFHAGTRWGVDIDGEPQQAARTASGYERWLCDFFRLEDLKRLRNLTYRPQRDGGLFLGMPDAEKRSFFAEIIGLQRFEALADRAKGEQAAAELRVVKAEAAIEQCIEVTVPTPPIIPAGFDVNKTELERRLDQEAEDFSIHELPMFYQHDLDVTSRRIQELDSALSIINQAETNRTKAVRQEAEDSVVPTFVARVTAAEVEHARTAARVNKARSATLAKSVAVEEQQRKVARLEADEQNLSRQLRETRTEEARLLAEFNQLQQEVCPTCTRTWTDVRQRQTLEATKERLVKAEQLMRTLPGDLQRVNDTIVAERQLLTAAREKLQLMRDTMPSIEIEERSAAMAVAAVREEQRQAIAAAVDAGAKLVREESLARRQELQDSIRKAHDDLNRLKATQREREQLMAGFAAKQRIVRQQWENYRYAQQVYNEAIESHRKYEAKASGLRQELQAAEAEVKQWSDLQACCKAFLGAISEEILAEIAAESNEILAAIPNTAEVSLRFVTERVTQKGTVRQEIKPVISKAGIDGLNPKSQISGGQLTSVELATDPAVSLVMRGRRGSQPTPAWMAFDEAFDGHDVPLKEAFLEVVASLAARGMQVIVVDHGSEFKESVEHRINVICRDGVSSVVTDQEFDECLKPTT